MSPNAIARSILIPLGCVVCLTTLSCARQELRGQEVSGLDRKLSTFAFIEEGDLVTFIVDTRGAPYRADEGYIPFEICVANQGLRNLELTRESFTLVDEEKNRYPAAGPKELIEGYEFLDFDRRSFTELESIVFNRFSVYTRYSSNFSPTRSGGRVVRDRVSLPKWGYMIDFIYFPTPQTGVLGKKFEIFMNSPNLPDPVFVKFAIRE